MKFTLLVGSIRQDSYNKKLAHFIQQRYAHKVVLEILTLEDIPMYNQDLELTPPVAVQQMKETLRDSDGIIFVTPEYNHSIPGVLKNAIDWCSRVDRVLVGKPATMVGASSGVLGTVRAQNHLRQILNSPGVSSYVLPGNECLIGTVQDKMDDQGMLIHEDTVQHLDKWINNFIQWVDKHNI